MVGRTISHYRIEEKLGEGGMGVVYRARDLNLGRNAAIKFLSSAHADEDRRRRFQQEAQAASSLNHPHIVTVYEAGTVDGQQFLATEFVDGGTLREWARHEERSARQIVEMLAGIADALACAHQAAILHRDIKPENILIAKAGYAKLADFGLAKMLETESDPDMATRTLDAAKTRPGVILGTVAYLSPEQAAGRRVDARSDIFAFGVVLYELLAGQRPFGGDSDVDLLHAILHRPARPLADVRPDLLYDLRVLVEKALEKDAGDRYQSMREIVVDLKRIQRLRTAETPAVAVTPPPPRRARRWGALAAGGVIALGLGAAGWGLYERATSWKNPLDGARFQRLTDFPGDEMHAAISSDGKFVVFVSDRDGPFDGFVTQTGAGEFVNVTKGRAPELAHEVVRTAGFSRDGSQVWFNVNVRPEANIAVMPTVGGALRPFLPRAVDAAWSPDGATIAYHEGTGGDPIFLTDRSGGNARRIFIEESGKHCHYLVWSPDGRHLYFVRGIPTVNEDIWRMRPDGSQPERITHHQSRVAFPAFLDERTLIYSAPAEDGSGPWLYAMDIERRLPQRVSLGVERYLSVSATADGRRLVATVSNPSSSLWTVPLSGRTAQEAEAARLSLPTVRSVSPRYGPGSILYVSSHGGPDGLWKFQDGNAIEVWKASEGGQIGPPAVSADGRELCFSFRRQVRGTMYCMSADGTGARTLAGSLNVRGTVSWSPDGKWIAVGADTDQGMRLFKVPVVGGQPVRLVDEPSFNPVWSPDGRFIVYSGPQVGIIMTVKAVTPEGVPVPMPDIGVRAGGERYRLSPDGKSLIVLQGIFSRQDFWLFDLQGGGKRQLTQLQPGYSVRGFDISPDGKQILFDRMRENSDIVLIDLKP